MKTISLRLLTIVMCVMASAIGARARAAEQTAQRPNIVLFIADDHAWFDAGCYGNAAVKTPNIDALAASGMRFTRAYTAEAICGPSRATLYTGLYPYRNGGYHQHSAIREGVQTLPTQLKSLGYYVGICGKTDCKPESVFPFDARLGEEEFDAFLAQAKGRPFCVVVATHFPHRPFAQKAKGNKYDESAVLIPPYLVDTPQTRTDMARNYGAVTSMDERLGAVMKSVKQRGLEESTLFIYTSDHGQSYPFSKWTCYEAGLKIPFVVRWPGHTKAGAVSDAMVSFIDVVPTFIEAAGGKPRDSFDGRSIAGVLEGKTERHHDLIFGTYTHSSVSNATGDFPIRSVRSETHKYIRNISPKTVFSDNITAEGEDIAFWHSWELKAKTDPFAAARVTLYRRRPAEELYDLRTDPWELHNVADDPANAAALAELRGKLDAWMKQQGDPGQVDPDFTSVNRRKQKPSLPATKGAAE